ncbi:PREDICTED: polyadenylate-binding protein-interacting protein 11-like [Nicotiana attenuata]|uniref:Polyadenylate-binding protein-interacting protein 11 n=1 Tax=Nicotiana attenuata TaxID=49451 RepID=A0A1J6JTP3_NICAT|nr:PREDICTED: polyadenylate-binding protein-interacting protein 11-like [Nicotiana attenuata]XP_019239323.1 PREDICTED: polyadenylate-binding protein-interacting protein 11-like [Nicotiana attenuata]OIT21101.1 polyadenylate-binding protein-interacting protein 11 [Nicotiana attenuata]
MAVVENAGININVVGSSNPGRIVQKDAAFDHHQSVTTKQNGVQRSKMGPTDQNFRMVQQETSVQHSINGNGVLVNHNMVQHEHQKMNGIDLRNGDDGEEGFKKEMRDLEEMFSKLNPMAEEFVPLSLTNHRIMPFPPSGGGVQFGFDATNNFVMQSNQGVSNANSNRRKKNGFGYGRRRMNTRTGMAQREDVIRRTVYVSDIDHQVTEEQLAALFLSCGQVVDCRICGDTNSVLRFAFIEFTDEEGARSALSLAGTMLGFYPVRVLPSKTAIAPVNPTFLPRSEDEREMCARTVYCTNIDKKVTQADVKLFFESFCGEVHRLRLLGDYHHSTRLAFVEFVMAESAIAALNCSGAILGSLPIRVSPSKTPVRPRAPRSPVL